MLTTLPRTQEEPNRRDMPPDLQTHIRYPEDLFRIQAQIYQAYHMIIARLPR